MGAIDGWNEAIVRLRRKAGLKQGEAAEKAGLSPAQLSRYEAGVASPTLRTLGRLLDVYEANLDDLAAAAREAKCATSQAGTSYAEPVLTWLASGWLDKNHERPELHFVKECFENFRTNTREGVLDALVCFFDGEAQPLKQEAENAPLCRFVEAPRTMEEDQPPPIRRRAAYEKVLEARSEKTRRELLKRLMEAPRTMEEDQLPPICRQAAHEEALGSQVEKRRREVLKRLADLHKNEP
ncbi:MAG TPA: helix-turn-helix transcriptional regulator [Thermoanaerobaculia bacterium]|jgi:transcriptional regulator with XRE-family HTH domain|nr:helix-turn-helix transcriptional regulator [Thermoanaerobaculia bacterium]